MHSKGDGRSGCDLSSVQAASDRDKAITHQQGAWLPCRLCWLNSGSLIGIRCGITSGSVVLVIGGLPPLPELIRLLRFFRTQDENRRGVAPPLHRRQSKGDGRSGCGLSLLYRSPVIGIRQPLTSMVDGCPGALLAECRVCDGSEMQDNQPCCWLVVLHLGWEDRGGVKCLGVTARRPRIRYVFTSTKPQKA